MLDNFARPIKADAKSYYSLSRHPYRVIPEGA